MAIFLVLIPLILFLAHTIVIIAFGTISQNSPANQTTATIFLSIIFTFFGALLLLWMLWLRSVVYAVQETEIGISRRWFKIAYIIVWLFIVFNLMAPLLKSYLENSGWREYLYLISASQEVINFGGIIIAYPIICHYAALATVVKQSNKQATFLSATPFTLVLIFGTVLGIPFLHKYFSDKNTTNPEILTIYIIGFGFFMATLIVGFLAAITGYV